MHSADQVTYRAGPNLGVGGELVGVLWNHSGQRLECERRDKGSTHVADVEEQALQTRELVRGDLKETGVVVCNTAGGGLVRAECICTCILRELWLGLCGCGTNHWQ